MPDFTPHATAPTVLDPKVFFRRFSLLAGAGALLLVALLGLLAVVAITHKKAEVVAQVEQRQQLLAGAYAASVQAWLGRATQVADDFAAAEATRAFASGLTSSGVAVKNFRQLFDQLGAMQQMINGVATYNQMALAITDPMGLPVLSSQTEPSPSASQQAAAQAAMAQQTTVVAPARQTPTGLVVDVYKPIRAADPAAPALGALWLQLPLDAGFAALATQAIPAGDVATLVLTQPGAATGARAQISGNPPVLVSLESKPEAEFFTTIRPLPHTAWAVQVSTPREVALASYHQYQLLVGFLLLLAVGLVAVVVALTYWWLQGAQYKLQLRHQLHEAKLADQAVNALARTIEARDPYLAGHSVRVAELATQLAARMGAAPVDQFALRVAAKLMGIGKLSVPMEVLNKATPLTAAERRQLQSHILHAEKVLLEVDFPAPVHTIISHSAERLDGSGYPRQLAGDKIHPLARILTVADVFCALTEPRVYREKLSDNAALETIFAERHKYDEAVLAALAAQIASPPA